MVVSSILLFLGVYIGVNLSGWLSKAISYFEKKKLINTITPKAAKENLLCKTPHNWIKAVTLTDNGTVVSHVCSICGLISGTDKVASQEAIDRIEDNNRMIEIEEKLYQGFLALEDEDIKKFMDEELKNGLQFKKLEAIHAAGMSFLTRYRSYKLLKADEIEKEFYKGDS